MKNKNNEWKHWYTFAIILVAVIGWFGIFWTMNLTDIEFDIEMDDNSREVFKEAIDTTQDRIETCETTCQMLFDRYNNYESNIACVGNWCRKDCFKICFEEAYNDNY